MSHCSSGGCLDGIDARDRALAHAHAGAAVAGDEPAEELEQVGIVADHQHAVAIGVLFKQLLEVLKVGGRIERGAHFDLGLVAELGADKLRGLQGALERAGDDHIDLDVEGAEGAGHQHALLLAFFDKGALGIQGGIFAPDARVSVAHEIENHRVGWGLPVGRLLLAGSILTDL